jgi:hypothetical protein
MSFRRISKAKMFAEFAKEIRMTEQAQENPDSASYEPELFYDKKNATEAQLPSNGGRVDTGNPSSLDWLCPCCERKTVIVPVASRPNF